MILTESGSHNCFPPKDGQLVFIPPALLRFRERGAAFSPCPAEAHPQRGAAVRGLCRRGDDRASPAYVARRVSFLHFMERYQLYATSPSSLSSSRTSRSSQASSAPRTISSKNNAIRHEPNWASKRGPPSLYIGPWQEFALGRAIAQHPPRRSGALQAPSEEASEEELSQFVAAFKDMAADLDEDGAKKLLKWSPLFMPSIPGLMLPAQPGAPRAAGRSRMPAAREAGHRSASSSNTTGCRQASGKARQVPSAVAELRDARVQKLQQLYGCGASSTSCTGGECSSAPAPELLSRSGSMPNTPGKVRTPGSGTKPGSPGNEDEWEDEVDGLLLWTSELQVPPSPG